MLRFKKHIHINYLSASFKFFKPETHTNEHVKILEDIIWHVSCLHCTKLDLSKNEAFNSSPNQLVNFHQTNKIFVMF